MGIERLAEKLNINVLQPALSMTKVLLRSHKTGKMKGEARESHRPLIVMGNGPSLRSFIEYAKEHKDEISSFDLEAVNFAAISEEYFFLRPAMYTLADPHFFSFTSGDEKVERLWENLARTDWEMKLWLPASQRKAVEKRTAGLPPCVSICWMNLTPVEGRGPLVNWLIDTGAGMPRPRNVLIAAIMTALRAGYKKIFLVGADHSWIKTLWVDDANHVVSVQPHFYKDDEKEKARVQSEYAGYHLHDILGSMTVAFKSYFDILHHTGRRGVEIINATPESFIDAFPRCDYAQMNKQ